MDLSLSQPVSLRSVHGYGLHTIQYPTGRWGFVGTLPTDLATKVVATTSDVMGGRAFMEDGRPMTWKWPVFDTETDAVAFAHAKGFEVRS